MKKAHCITAMGRINRGTTHIRQTVLPHFKIQRKRSISSLCNGSNRICLLTLVFSRYAREGTSQKNPSSGGSQSMAFLSLSAISPATLLRQRLIGYYYECYFIKCQREKHCFPCKNTIEKVLFVPIQPYHAPNR